jgi:type I restriction enzyme, R subunit
MDLIFPQSALILPVPPGPGKADLSHLDDAFVTRMLEQRNPHLVVEALRRLVEKEMRAVTKHNVVAQQIFPNGSPS